MTTRSGLRYQHTPIDIFNLKVEEEFIVTERFDPKGFEYVKSLANAEKKTLKVLKSLGITKPEECFKHNFERFKKAKIESQTTYKASEKSCEFFGGVVLPGRLWAHNPCTCQSMWGPMRATLIGENTLDIDQKKSWMRCLRFICRELEKKEWETPNGPKKIKIITEYLDDWIENADSLISQWMMAKRISKKSIKKKLATMANWGGNFKTGFDSFQKLNKEIINISAQLSRVPEFKKYVKYCEEKMKKSEKCPTLVGVLTQAVESALTWACVREIRECGGAVAAIIHDGMNVYKSDKFTPESLVELCDEVCEFIAPNSAKWAHKEPDYQLYDDDGKELGHEFRIPDDFKMECESGDVDDENVCPCGCGCAIDQLESYGVEEIPVDKLYDNIKVNFEKYHCQVHSSYIDEEKKFPEPCVCTQNELHTKMHGRVKYYKHCWIKDQDGDPTLETKKYNFFPVWNDDEDKRFFRDFDVYPNVDKCPKDVYNLWQGYAVMRKAKGRSKDDFTIDIIRGVAFFMRHVHRLIDDSFRDFFYEYWSHLLKYPDIKPGILLGLLGHKRIGKGQTIDMISNQIGPRYYCLTSHPGRDVWGQNGTDYCDGKMLCRLAEPKKEEYSNDPGAMRVWITDNPVERKAMHKRAETIHNYTRFIHDGNDPVLPDEENGGRIAQTLCNSYWKDKWIDDPQKFVEYNTSLGQYIENDLVQVLLAFMLLKIDCPKRFSFHRINEVTGNFAKEERKRNRTLIEKFLIYVIETVPWDKKILELTESSSDENDMNTIEYHVSNWSRLQSFREPMKARSISTMLGNWMSMKHGGITKERPWIASAQRLGNTVFRFDLNYLRTKFSMDEVRENAINDTKIREHRNDVKRFPMAAFMTTDGHKHHDDDSCMCDDKACEMSDERLLEKYISEVVTSCRYGDFQQWLDDGTLPSTYNEDRRNIAADTIQYYWCNWYYARKEQGEVERAKKLQEEELERQRRLEAKHQKELDDWNERQRIFKQNEEDERRRQEEAKKQKFEAEYEESLRMYPPNPTAKCTVHQKYGGGDCAPVKVGQPCACGHHSKSCNCFQCVIVRRHTE